MNKQFPVLCVVIISGYLNALPRDPLHHKRMRPNNEISRTIITNIPDYHDDAWKDDTWAKYGKWVIGTVLASLAAHFAWELYTNNKESGNAMSTMQLMQSALEKFILGAFTLSGSKKNVGLVGGYLGCKALFGTMIQ